MDYLELISNYDDSQKIPYAELLNTAEWKNRRKSIIERDKSTCTQCGKTQSIFHFPYNITFQTRDRIIINSIIDKEKSVDEIKRELNVDKISILKSPYNENTFCGIAPNGELFLANGNKIKQTDKEDLSIYHGKTEHGFYYYIIDKRNSHFSNYSIPLLSEKSIVLHVHHKFYIQKKLPWEYADDSLITLCNWCHWELHEQTIIPIYENVDGELRDLNYTPCIRCNGAGVFPEYRHVQNGICFRCNGNCYEELI